MKSIFSVFLLLSFLCLPLLGCVELNRQRPPEGLYIDAYYGDPEAEFKLAAIYSKGEGAPKVMKKRSGGSSEPRFVGYRRHNIMSVLCLQGFGCREKCC